jgi:general stress protein YciG
LLVITLLQNVTARRVKAESGYYLSMGWIRLRAVSPLLFILIYRTTRQEQIMTTHRGGSGNFAENRERAAEAGRKGGKNSGGNFKNDPQRAARAGEKGGRSSPKKADA